MSGDFFFSNPIPSGQCVIATVWLFLSAVIGSAAQSSFRCSHSLRKAITENSSLFFSGKRSVDDLSVTIDCRRCFVCLFCVFFSTPLDAAIDRTDLLQEQGDIDQTSRKARREPTEPPLIGPKSPHFTVEFIAPRSGACGAIDGQQWEEVQPSLSLSLSLSLSVSLSVAPLSLFRCLSAVKS